MEQSDIYSLAESSGEVATLDPETTEEYDEYIAQLAFAYQGERWEEE